MFWHGRLIVPLQSVGGAGWQAQDCARGGLQDGMPPSPDVSAASAKPARI
jgi:hypothetical protein